MLNFYQLFKFYYEYPLFIYHCKCSLLNYKQPKGKAVNTDHFLPLLEWG